VSPLSFRAVLFFFSPSTNAAATTRYGQWRDRRVCERGFGWEWDRCTSRLCVALPPRTYGHENETHHSIDAQSPGGDASSAHVRGFHRFRFGRAGPSTNIRRDSTTFETPPCLARPFPSRLRLVPKSGVSSDRPVPSVCPVPSLCVCVVGVLCVCVSLSLSLSLRNPKVGTL
jgi:hypothetical protein